MQLLKSSTPKQKKPQWVLVQVASWLLIREGSRWNQTLRLINQGAETDFGPELPESYRITGFPEECRILFHGGLNPEQSPSREEELLLGTTCLVARLSWGRNKTVGEISLLGVREEEIKMAQWEVSACAVETR